MSKFIYCLLVLCLLVSCQKDSNDPNSVNVRLRKGLIAHYPFNGNANDESGNNYHLQVNEAILSSNRFGEPSKAYSFNGNTSYLTIPKLSKADSLRELTISLWMAPEVNLNQSMISFLANADPHYCSHFSGILFINAQYVLYNSWTTYFDSSYCSGIIYNDPYKNPLGTWAHLVLVQHYNTEDIASKRYSYTYYLNGSKLKTSPMSQVDPMPISFNHGGCIGCHISPFYSSGTLIYSDFFSGSIDDVRIYDRALPEDEIKDLYELRN